jgi:putative two-component system response regulator
MPAVNDQATAVGTALIADDEPACVDLAGRLMRRLGYTVTTAVDGAEALDAVRRDLPDIVLLDVEMPYLSGIEVCRRLKSDPATRLIPIVLITGLSANEDRVRGIEAGADDVLTKPFHPEELEARVRSLKRLKRYTDELDSAESVILSLALTVEARDHYTKGHCERLAHYATVLGARLGLGEEERAALFRGGYLHDIGKIGIPDHVLLKPAPLTKDEYALMKEHTIIGDRLCGELRSLRLVRPIVRHHHERLDGSGYPDGLRGAELSLEVRILGVCDVYDALTSERVYRRSLPQSQALMIMDQGRGSAFDPGVLDALSRVVGAAPAAQLEQAA